MRSRHPRYNLTPEAPPRKACRGCTERTEDCHAHCERYAAEVIIGALVHKEVESNAQLAIDLFRVEHRRKNCGLY